MLEEVGRGYGVVAWRIGALELDGVEKENPVYVYMSIPLIRQSSVLSLLPTLGFSMKNCVSMVSASL